MSEPVLYETHAHTPLCRHAAGEPQQYAAVAAQRGLKGVTFTCHNPLPDGIAQGSRMYPEQFDDYLELIDHAAAQCNGDSDVRLGLECDYLPGLEPFLERQLKTAPFDYVLGSVHPQISEYAHRFDHGNDIEFQKGYFTHLADLAETKLIDTLSHPDLVKNLFPDDWDLGLIFDHVCRCLDRIAGSGTAMELNTSGVNKAISEMNPSVTMLEQMRARGIPVVIGADAHVPARVGDGFDKALRTLADVGYTHVSFFLERERRDVPIDAALASLKPAPEAGQTAAIRS